VIELPNGLCPRCGAAISHSTVELHPSLKDTAIQNFVCAKCGPVKSVVFSIKPESNAKEADK
jgi:hypothetical protein